MSRSMSLETALLPFESGFQTINPDISLSQAMPGEEVRLVELGVAGMLGRRLLDLGFTPGVRFRVVRVGPGGNLIAVSLRGTTVALRVSEVNGVGVSRAL